MLPKQSAFLLHNPTALRRASLLYSSQHDESVRNLTRRSYQRRKPKYAVPNQFVEWRIFSEPSTQSPSLIPAM